VQSLRSANPNMTFVNRKDLNMGVQALLLNRTVGFEANVFQSIYDGMIAAPSSLYPSFFTPDFLPLKNYEITKYQGFEIGLNYTGVFNDWRVFAGANLLYNTSVRTKVEEIRAYDHLKREGRPADAYFGLEHIRLFRDLDDISESPAQLFGNPKPGDIKYKSQRKDGDIIDPEDDQAYLGRSQSPLYAGLHISLSYKNISLMVRGEAQTGSIGFKDSEYYWIYGNRKYSEVMKNAWTEDNVAKANYPRLTTGASDNNFRRSTFWMYKRDFFQISRIQLSYRMPEKLMKAIFLSSGELFGYVTDPLLFSANKGILELSPKGAPYFRSYVLGVSISF